MPITHQTEGHANHPAWIRCELDWILASQPLVSLGSGPLQAPLAALGALDTGLLATEIAEQWAWNGPPKRLGRRFEHLLSALFDAIPDMRVLGHGIPIHAGDQTRGEIDFLLSFRHAIIHLEVALKYYAGVGDAADRLAPIRWVGPSTEDRLDRKINHLLTHQLPLSEDPGTLQVLARRDLPAPTHRQAWIFGRLIHPYHEALNSAPPTPDSLFSTTGNYWCCYRDRDQAFRILSRPVGSTFCWLPVGHDALIGQHHGPAQLPLIATQHLVANAHHTVLALVSRAMSKGPECARLWILPDDFVERAWVTHS